MLAGAATTKDLELPDTPLPVHRDLLPVAPPPKRRRLEVPVRKVQEEKRQAKLVAFEEAWHDIKKTLTSKKTEFVGGPEGLQAHRARTIESFLQMVVKQGWWQVDASERAAESHGFAQKWGGRCVREWARVWIRERELPLSRRGQHTKVFTLLEDPVIQAELRAFIRSKKWAMDPVKLQEFTEGTLLPRIAGPYL